MMTGRKTQIDAMRHGLRLLCAGALLLAVAMPCRAAEENAPMSKLTPEQAAMWDFTPLRETPLDVEIYSSKVVDGCQVQDVFFTSQSGPDGPNRVYLGVAFPADREGPFPVLLDLHGGGGVGTSARALSFAKEFDVFAMAMDWGGKSESDPNPLRTVWRYPKPGTETTTGTRSSAYRTAMGMRRALDFAATQPMVDMSKVVVYGGSWGSYYTTLLAGIDERITDAVALTGAGGWDDSRSIIADGINLLPPALRDEWLRQFDPISYADNVRADVSLVAHANDSFFWFGGVMRHFDRFPGPKRVIITPNSDHGIGTFPEPIATWPFTYSILQHHIEGVPFPEVTRESVREVAPDVFEWETAGPQVEGAHLYFSPGDVNWRSTYWVELPARREGQAWRAELPEHLQGLAGNYFVTVCASDNRCVSSPVMWREGKNPQRDWVNLWPINPLWDVSAGIRAWRQSIYKKETVIEPAGPEGLRVTPGSNDLFLVRTDSTVLLGPRAGQFAGLEIVVNGEGQAGELRVQLLDDDKTRNIPNIYEARVPYGEGETTLVIPWVDFEAPECVREGGGRWPFESLALTGVRPGRKPLTFVSIRLADKE